MLVAPKRVQRGIVMLERRLERFDRQRKDLLHAGNAAAGRQCRRIGQQRCGTRRAVDQRAALLDVQLEAEVSSANSG